MFIAMRKEKPSKYMDKIADYTVKCKCGHSVIFPNKEDRIICGWCGHYVYKNDKARFKYKLKEEINKNKGDVKNENNED